MKKEWYYQIKGKLSEPVAGIFGSNQNWSFPPIFSGKVTANDKKEAHALINDEYGKQFPLRVLAKDLDSNEFLLNITEITDGRTKELFEIKTCQHCGITFRIIDSYNNTHINYKGSEYCSYECKQERYEIQRFIDTGNNELNGIHQPVIYQIYNVETGLRYIGKTTQAFTLRWYQHFYQCGDTKFHTAIKTMPLESWTFAIVEKIHIPNDIKSKKEIEQLIFNREGHYIKLYDSVKNGYNSLC